MGATAEAQAAFQALDLRTVAISFFVAWKHAVDGASAAKCPRKTFLCCSKQFEKNPDIVYAQANSHMNYTRCKKMNKKLYRGEFSPP
jgi:hypothetical protein